MTKQQSEKNKRHKHKNINRHNPFWCKGAILHGMACREGVPADSGRRFVSPGSPWTLSRSPRSALLSFFGWDLILTPLLDDLVKHAVPTDALKTSKKVGAWLLGRPL